MDYDTYELDQIYSEKEVASLDDKLTSIYPNFILKKIS